MVHLSKIQFTYIIWGNALVFRSIGGCLSSVDKSDSSETVVCASFLFIGLGINLATRSAPKASENSQNCHVHMSRMCQRAVIKCNASLVCQSRFLLIDE